MFHPRNALHRGPVWAAWQVRDAVLSWSECGVSVHLSANLIRMTLPLPCPDLLFPPILASSFVVLASVSSPSNCTYSIENSGSVGDVAWC